MHSRPVHQRGARTPAVRALAATLLVSAGGCQTYAPAPVDVAAHRASFLARTPSAETVGTFAESLKARGEAAPVFDLADGVSLPEAEVIALVYNAELRTARMRAGVTRATAANAGLWEDPTLGVDLTRIIQSTPEPWKVFATVGLTIPISGRLEVEKKLAGAEHSAELARLARAEWRVRAEVRRAWFERQALDARRETTREFVARLDQSLGVVDRMERAGELSRIEARLFRIDRATTVAELAQVESNAEQASLRLRELMGLAPGAPVQFAPSALGAQNALPEVDLAELEWRSPVIIEALAEHEAAEKALELEIQKQRPDLHIGPGYGREDGQDQVLFGLSAPLPLWNANRRAIAEANAKRDLARAGVEAALERQIASAEAARLRAEAARRRRQGVESDLVPLVDAQYDDMRRVAQLGEINTLVLLESLRRQQEAKLTLLDALRDESIARIDLEEILGPPIVSDPRSRPSETPSSNAPDRP